MWLAWMVFGLAVGASVVAALLPEWAWIYLVALPVGLVACLLILLRRPRRQPTPAAVTQVIVDGSNVMHWDGGAPSLDPVRAVVRNIEAQGMTPGVIFDANAGYKIGDRYMDDEVFAQLLGLPHSNVLVVPKGTSADSFILEAARRTGARIVTNDRFRDWQDRFPEVQVPETLIRGGFRNGVLWLEAATVMDGTVTAGTRR